MRYPREWKGRQRVRTRSRKGRRSDKDEPRRDGRSTETGHVTKYGYVLHPKSWPEESREEILRQHGTGIRTRHR